MGRVTFTEENKSPSAGDFPKLRLKAGERKRIVCVEDPVVEFVHQLEMPKVLNGRPKMSSRERKDGTTYEDYDREWLAACICLGDEGILTEKGVDTKNCPVCAMAAGSDHTKPPKRRFAMHVIVYNTKPGSFDLQSPFGCQCVIWAFTDKKFDKLVDIQREWGKLSSHDLLLGPCSAETFQTFEFGVASRAEWQIDDVRKKITMEAFKENQTKDLSSFCGRRMDRRFIEDYLRQISDRWRQINGGPAPDASTAAFDTLTMEAGLDDLLSAQTGAVTSLTDPDGLVGVPMVSSGTMVESSTSEPEADLPKPGSSGEVVSFDDLLQGL